MQKTCFIGLMSGTSMDGIDAVAAEFSGSTPLLLAAETIPYPKRLRTQLSRLLVEPGNTSLPLLLEIDHQIGEAFANAANTIKPQIPNEYRIAAIGSHGQTVFHHPQGPYPNSWQLGDPNLIAERTGITTIADFRRRDMATGGQGAPLAPAFHRAWLQQEHAVAILNLGGIANLTIIPSKNSHAPVTGFDTGPANTLLDGWVQQKLGLPKDENGGWAASGRYDEALLRLLASDAYFEQPPPKSTGREHFNIAWLSSRLKQITEPLADADIAATLVELVALSVSDAIRRHCLTEDVAHIYVCGGGVHNSYMMSRLQRYCCPIEVSSSAKAGIDPDYMEALAFAWMACKTLGGAPIDSSDFTGARESRILGAVYQA